MSSNCSVFSFKKNLLTKIIHIFFFLNKDQNINSVSIFSIIFFIYIFNNYCFSNISFKLIFLRNNYKKNIGKIYNYKKSIGYKSYIVILNNTCISYTAMDTTIIKETLPKIVSRQ